MTRNQMGDVFCILPVLLLLRSDFIHCDYSLAAPDCMLETKWECHYHNETQRVRYLYRFFYNQEETVYFDSDVGYFIPRTEYGRPDADYWNNNKEIIERQKHDVERFCITSYDVSKSTGAIGRRVEPSVRVSLMPQHEDPDSEQHMLMCNVFGFYPSEIEVKWYRNGQEENAAVQSTELFQNGDWTFQIHVMLETEIQEGDNYTCEVHHVSLTSPIRVTWKPEISESIRNKKVTGIVGFVLGAVFIIVGLVIYIRGRKAQTSFRGPQTEHFIHT